METPRTTGSTSLALSYNTSARRSCPYRRTPYQRRIAAPRPLSESPAHPGKLHRSPASEASQQPGALPGLVNKTWKVFHLSPLYRFHTHTQSLRQYGRSLATYIAQGIDKEVAVDGNSNKQCIFSIYEGLRVSAVDPEAVQILVTSKNGNGRKEGELMTAVLCGVELEASPCRDMKKHFTYYPILLVKASVAYASLLTNWLEQHFDCRIYPLVPCAMDLAWMVAMWSGTDTGRKSKPVELMYRVPEECKGLSRITYTVDAADCKVLWDSIRCPDNEEFTGEEVGAFIKSLEEHFYECFKVKLWKMQLMRIGTSVAYVGDGKVKMFSAEDAWQVLRFLSELALEKFQMLGSF